MRHIWGDDPFSPVRTLLLLLGFTLGENFGDGGLGVVVHPTLEGGLHGGEDFRARVGKVDLAVGIV